MADTGVFLLNMGGPDRLEAVEPFLYNLFSDREIIKLGPGFLQKPIARYISKKKAPKSREMYSKIGGASPLLGITEAQAFALKAQLMPHGEFNVYVGMRYWKPYTKDVLKKAVNDGIKQLVVLTLYPHYSKATTGSSISDFKRAVKGLDIDCVYIDRWFEQPTYITCLRETLRQGLEGFDYSPDVHVLFSAHSLPQSFVDEGDPYVEHIEATIKALVEGSNFKWSLGYQSKTGPVKWLEPATEDELKRLSDNGVKKILMVPISFVSDHIETLYEIDILYKEEAERLGMQFRRSDAPNVRGLFISALKELVLEAVKERGWQK